MTITKFFQEVEKHYIADELAVTMEGMMIPLEIIFHQGMYYHLKFSDVNFDSFCYSDAIRAMEEAIYLQTGEADEEEAENRNNLVVQVARNLHFKNIINELKTKKDRRFI